MVKNGKITKIMEKPKVPPTNLAVTGIYFLTQKIFDIIERADGLRPDAYAFGSTFSRKGQIVQIDIDKIETHRESRSFLKGKKLVISSISGVKIGFTICYDLRFPLLYRQLAKKGAQIILIPAAFTVPTGKAHWETLIRARAIENSVFISATNMCGLTTTMMNTAHISCRNKN